MGWPYVLHTPGHPELGEDYLKQLVQLRAARDPLGKAENLHWYYLSDQEPDEELIVKLFDSISLGENAQEADVPFYEMEKGGRASKYRHLPFGEFVAIFLARAAILFRHTKICISQYKRVNSTFWCLFTML